MCRGLPGRGGAQSARAARSGGKKRRTLSLAESCRWLAGQSDVYCQHWMDSCERPSPKCLDPHVHDVNLLQAISRSLNERSRHEPKLHNHQSTSL